MLRVVHSSLEGIWSVRYQDRIWGSSFVCTYHGFGLFNLRHQIFVWLCIFHFHKTAACSGCGHTISTAVLSASSQYKLKIEHKEPSHRKIVILSLLSEILRNTREWQTFNPMMMMMLGWRLIHIKQNLCGLEQWKWYLNTSTCIVYSLPKTSLTAWIQILLQNEGVFNQ